MASRLYMAKLLILYTFHIFSENKCTLKLNPLFPVISANFGYKKILPTSSLEHWLRNLDLNNTYDTFKGKFSILNSIIG